MDIYFTIIMNSKFESAAIFSILSTGYGKPKTYSEMIPIIVTIFMIILRRHSWFSSCILLRIREDFRTVSIALNAPFSNAKLQCSPSNFGFHEIIFVGL